MRPHLTKEDQVYCHEITVLAEAVLGSRARNERVAKHVRLPLAERQSIFVEVRLVESVSGPLEIGVPNTCPH
jgi:hypothetical protein